MRHSLFHLLLILTGAWVLFRLAEFAAGSPRRVSQQRIENDSNKKMGKFDGLTVTAAQLQRLFEAKEISSVDIVKSYLVQHNYNGVKLRAIITVAPTDHILTQA